MQTTAEQLTTYSTRQLQDTYLQLFGRPTGTRNRKHLLRQVKREIQRRDCASQSETPAAEGETATERPLTTDERPEAIDSPAPDESTPESPAHDAASAVAPAEAHPTTDESIADDDAATDDAVTNASADDAPGDDAPEQSAPTAPHTPSAQQDAPATTTRRRHVYVPKERRAPRKDPRIPPSGTVLTREYRGRTIQVLIRDEGFECDDEVFTSLSTLVKKVTGTTWNGFAFFGLNHKNGDN